MADFLIAHGDPLAGKPNVHRVLAAGSANATNVKAAPGTVFGWAITNANASARYVKLYNKATAPDSSDTPLATIHVAGSGSREFSFPIGIPFSAGIGYRIVTGVADNDNTSVTASDVQMTLLWK